MPPSSERREPDAVMRQPVSPEPTLRHLVATVERTLRQALSERVSRFGLTVAGYTALFVLRRSDDMSNADIARYLGVTPQATNQILQVLIGEGLIERRPSEADRRVVTNRLTAEGDRVIAECEREAAELEGEVFAVLSARELSGLRRALLKTTAALGALEVSTSTHTA